MTKASQATVGLFDAQNRIPQSAWERHFRPAWERREKARANGRKGAERRWGGDGDPIATPYQPDSNGIADGYQTDSESMPDKPTVLPSDNPTVSPSGPGPTVGPKKNGLKSPDEERDELLAKLNDPATPAGVLPAIEARLKQLDAGRPN